MQTQYNADQIFEKSREICKILRCCIYKNQVFWDFDLWFKDQDRYVNLFYIVPPFGYQRLVKIS